MDNGFAIQSTSRKNVGEMKPLVLLKTFCRVSERRLLFGQARLFPDWIVVSGWGLGGFYHERILLSEIQRVEWKSDLRSTPVLLLFLKEGGAKGIRMRGAAVWKFALDERISSGKRNALILRSTRKYAHHRIYVAPMTPVA